MKFSSWVVIFLFLFINQIVKCGDIVVSEPEIDDETEEKTSAEGDDDTSIFESMTIVASVDGRLHGFDANNNKKWTSESSGPLSSHHSSGNQLDFSGKPFPSLSTFLYNSNNYPIHLNHDLTLLQ